MPTGSFPHPGPNEPSGFILTVLGHPRPTRLCARTLWRTACNLPSLNDLGGMFLIVPWSPCPCGLCAVHDRLLSIDRSLRSGSRTEYRWPIRVLLACADRVGGAAMRH